MNHETAPSEFEGYAHVIGPGALVGVFVVLMVLTFATVAATWVDLGPFNLWIAMGIATTKAVLVALYFMHLRYDNPFNTVVFLAALVTIALFVALTLLDSTTCQIGQS